MHFGIISPPVSGHLHPFGALGRELIARGHRVTLVHMPDLASRAEAEGLAFAPVGETSHPLGTLPKSLARLGQLDGLAALRFTIGEVRDTTEMMLRDGSAALRAIRADALVVDQSEPAGGTLAERLGIPFVTICNALALNREDDVPPPFTSWSFKHSSLARLKNRLGYSLSDWTLRRVRAVVAAYRKQWSLPPHISVEESFSTLAQLSQQPPAFDFPRKRLPETFHYVGPLRGPALRPVPFPWDKLDGRPLVYASLGTLQNGKERIFRAFAEACQPLACQIVITHGGGLDAQAVASLPGNPLVVSYAPQLEVLARASLTLTHAGLNTVLDSLSHGVPLVAVPITYEQPAIAKRISWTGSGRIVPFRGLNVPALRSAIAEVLGNPSYTVKAQTVARSIQDSGGVKRAADVIESVLGCGSGTCSIRPSSST
jgi:zeaxanthin glucosyltransferase